MVKGLLFLYTQYYAAISVKVVIINRPFAAGRKSKKTASPMSSVKRASPSHKILSSTTKGDLN